MPRGSYRIPGPPLWLLVSFFAAALLLAVAVRFRRRGWTAMALVPLAATVIAIALHPFAPKLEQGKLEVTILDVGQGDSIFLASPRGHTMLIDGGGTFAAFHPEAAIGGPDPGEDAVSPYLWSRGIQRLDVVALTHAHMDHLGGLLAVLDNFEVGSLWISREVSTPAFVFLEQLARNRKIPVRHERRGAAFVWDGVSGRVLWPEDSPEDAAPQPKNNDSLVLRLQYGKRVLLLPGDIERQAESKLLAEEPSLRADFLKVAHHGSKNSTLAALLYRVAPRFAAISAGRDNPYGHPHPDVLERLRQTGVRTVRTDENGAITVLTDGDWLGVSCYAACPSP